MMRMPSSLLVLMAVTGFCGGVWQTAAQAKGLDPVEASQVTPVLVVKITPSSKKTPLTGGIPAGSLASTMAVNIAAEVYNMIPPGDPPDNVGPPDQLMIAFIFSQAETPNGVPKCYRATTLVAYSQELRNLATGDRLTLSHGNRLYVPHQIFMADGTPSKASEADPCYEMYKQSVSK